MQKDELVHALEQSRSDFLKSIAGLSDEQLNQPGACGQWSVKDVLAHLMMWEAETIKCLYQTRHGMTPTTVHTRAINDDDQNAVWYRLTKDRPYDLVWQDFDAIRAQTIQRVEDFSSEEIFTPGRFAWLKGKPLLKVIQVSILDHENEHREGIETWRKKLAVKEG